MATTITFDGPLGTTLGSYDSRFKKYSDESLLCVEAVLNGDGTCRIADSNGSGVGFLFVNGQGTEQVAEVLVEPFPDTENVNVYVNRSFASGGYRLNLRNGFWNLYRDESVKLYNQPHTIPFTTQQTRMKLVHVIDGATHRLDCYFNGVLFGSWTDPAPITTGYTSATWSYAGTDRTTTRITEFTDGDTSAVVRVRPYIAPVTTMRAGQAAVSGAGTIGIDPAAIAVAAKRYDGASGATTVYGSIPLQPGQLVAANVGNVAIFDGPTQLPITVTAGDMTHGDGSLKTISIAANVTLNSAETKNLTLRVDTAPTAGGAGAVTVNYAWMQSPRLLYCTDASHLCKSKIAPLPLVPLNHPSVPARWYTHLTTEFEAAYLEAETAGLANQPGNNAEYDWPYEAMCHYICTGDVVWLRRAMLGYLNDGTNATQWYNYTRLVPQWIPSTDAYPNPQGNPEGLATLGGTQTAAGQEQWSKVLGAAMIYAFTRWPMAKAHVSTLGAWAYQEQNVYTTTPAGGPRAFLRWSSLPSIISRWMGNGAQEYVYGNAPDAQGATFKSKIDARRDLVDTAANAYSDYRKGIWGFWNTYNDNGGDASIDPAYPPTFQFSVVAPWAVLQHYHLTADARVQTAIQKLADYLIYVCGPKVTASVNGYGVYQTYYQAFDPAAPNPNSFPGQGIKKWPDLMMMFKLTMAYAYAASGNTVYRDWADTIADARHNLYTLSEYMGVRWKEFGQIYLMSHHALAYRAGVAASGWWDGTTAPAGFDYFISPTGNDANPGTYDSPWAITALNTKRATYKSKTVGLLSGTYDVSAAHTANSVQYQPTFNIEGGTALAPTVIKSVVPRGAHITAKSGATYGGNTALVEHPGILGNNFLYNSVTPGYVTIDGLRISGTISTMLRFGLLDTAGGATLTPGIAVQNCELFDMNGATIATPGGNHSSISLNNCTAPIIRNNWVHDLTSYGTGGTDHLSAFIQWNTRNALYEYNTVENAGGGGVYDKRGAGFTNAGGGTVRYNYLDMSAYTGTLASTGISDFVGNPGSVVGGTTLEVHNNIVISAMGIKLDQGNVAGTRSSSETHRIFNNTMVMPPGVDTGYGAFFSTTAHTPGVNFYNNLMWGSAIDAEIADLGAVMMPVGPAGTMDYNIYPSSANKWTTFANGAGAYPSAGYATIADWRTATGKETNSSVALASSPFTNTGTRADKYKLTAATLPVGFGRLNGVGGGGSTVVDAGAWGGSPAPSRIGCDFAT